MVPRFPGSSCTDVAQWAGRQESSLPSIEMTEAGKPARKRRWRDYSTAAGRRPVTEFIAGVPDADAAAVVAAMRDVQENGTQVARHLRGDIYEVRADADRVIYRILFATEGRSSQVLLALEGFTKKTQKTPPSSIETAERRLADWRRRGRRDRPR